MERLDRIVTNKQWLTAFSNPGMEILTTSNLDHCPLFLNTMAHIKGLGRRRIFRYEAKWTLEEDGEQAVKLAWLSRNFSPNC